MSSFALGAALLAPALMAPSARGADYTWTNRVDGSSGYWTNGVLWGQTLSTTYPTNTDSAYLTNSFAGSYTNILNYGIGTLNTLALSNSLGQAWLVITQGASAVTLNVANFKFNTGGRLRIDTNATLNVTNFTWLGTNGTIYLNSGGFLKTWADVLIGDRTVGNTAQVTSVGSPGGTWDLAAQTLYVGNSTGNNPPGASFNALTIGGGVVVSNAGSAIIGAAVATFNYSTNVMGNAFTLTGSGTRLVVTGDFIVGFANERDNKTAASSNNVATVSAGAFAVSTNLYVGWALHGNASGTSLAHSSQLIIDGATWTNWNATQIGRTASDAGLGSANSNKLTVANGGTLYSGGGITIGGANANYNSLVMSADSFLRGAGAITVGATTVAQGTLGNTGVLYGAEWNGSGQALTVGSAVFSTAAGLANYNALSLSGVFTNFASATIGFLSSGPGADQAMLGNGLTLTGSGTRLMVTGGVTVGFAQLVNDNKTVYISNSTVVVSGGAIVVSTNLTVGRNQLTGGTGKAHSSSNSVTISGSTWTNWNTTVIGQSDDANGSATLNALTIKDGSTFYSGGGLIVGNGSVASRNSLIATGAATSVAGGGALMAGNGGFGNTGILQGATWNGGGQSLLVGGGGGRCQQ